MNPFIKIQKGEAALAAEASSAAAKRTSGFGGKRRVKPVQPEGALATVGCTGRHPRDAAEHHDCAVVCACIRCIGTGVTAQAPSRAPSQNHNPPLNPKTTNTSVKTHE